MYYFEAFSGCFDASNSILIPLVLTHIYIDTKPGSVNTFSVKQERVHTENWMWEPDRLWLVWPSLPSPRVWWAVVKITVMQQYLTAWTQALVFTQEAQVWVRPQNLCQLGFSHSQTCCTTYFFPPICYILYISEWATITWVFLFYAIFLLYSLGKCGKY